MFVFSEEPPAKPIQLWSKNQIAVEYDSDSETAAAPTTNRLVGKDVWKGRVIKKPKVEPKKHTPKEGSSSSSSSSKRKPSTSKNGSGSSSKTDKNSTGNKSSPGASADLKGIVSYYESEESDEPETGIIFPKTSRQEAYSKNRKHKLSISSNSKTSNNSTMNSEESVSFTMKSQNHSVPKPAVFNEQDEEKKHTIPKVKLPPQKKFVSAVHSPQVLESVIASKSEANITNTIGASLKTTGDLVGKSVVEAEKAENQGEQVADAVNVAEGIKDKVKSRSRSKSKKQKLKKSKKSQSRSRSSSRSYSRSGSSSRSRSRSSRSISYSYSTSRSRSSHSRSSGSSSDSYSSRSRSRSSSYRRSRHRRRSKRSSSRRRHRRRSRSSSYSDEDRISRRHVRGQPPKRKRRKRNKKRRITRAPNPPMVPRNPKFQQQQNAGLKQTQQTPGVSLPPKLGSGLGPKSFGTLDIGSGSDSNRRNSDSNEATTRSGQNAGKHITNEVPAMNTSNASLPSNPNSVEPKENPDTVSEQPVIIGPQLPKPNGIDEFIAHTSKLGVNVEEDMPNGPIEEKNALPENIPEEMKEKYSDLMSRLNNHIQKKEKSIDGRDDERSNGSNSVQPGAGMEGAVTPTGSYVGTSEHESFSIQNQSLVHHQPQQQQQYTVSPAATHYMQQQQQPQLIYVPTSQLQFLHNPAASHLGTHNMFLQQLNSFNPLLNAANLNFQAAGAQLPFMNLNNHLPLAGIPTLGHHHPSLLGQTGLSPLLSASHLFNPGVAAAASHQQQQLAAIYAQLLNQNSSNSS